MPPVSICWLTALSQRRISAVNAAGDNDNLTFNTAIANDVINDTLGNKLSDIVVNSFIVNTGAGNDSLVFNENISAVTVAIDLGDGNNQLDLAAI